MKKKSTADTSAAARLLSGIERIERLEEERKALAADVRDIKAELKSAGFDVKVVNQMLKERRMSAADRQEWQALCDVYRASLGMLDGTPLGEHTRSRLLGQPAEPAPGEVAPDDEERADAELLPEQATADPAQAEGTTRPQEPTAEEMLTARAEGAAAALAGKSVTSNPYAAGDIRRASWDEGWCASAGSDGMEIPAAFRRSTEKKPKGNGGKGTGN